MQFDGGLTKKTGKILTAAWAEFAGAISASSVYLRALTATMEVLAGSLTRQTSKILSGTWSVLAGSISRLTSQLLDSAWAETAGLLLKQTSKILEAAWNEFAGLLENVKTLLRALDAAWTGFSGSLIKQTSKFLPGIMQTLDGSMSRLTSKLESATNTLLDGSIIKQTSKLLSATLQTLDATLTQIKILTQTFVATTQLFAGSLTKQISHNISASTSLMIASLAKRTSKILNATMSAWSAILSTFWHGLGVVYYQVFNATTASITPGSDSVDLAWDASPDAVSYRVYYGTAPGVYNTFDAVPNQLTWTVDDLTPGIWYFAVTAIDIEGDESEYSNEVSEEILAPKAISLFAGSISKSISKILLATTALWLAILTLIWNYISPPEIICIKYLDSFISMEIPLESPITMEIILDGDLCR